MTKKTEALSKELLSMIDGGADKHRAITIISEIISESYDEAKEIALSVIGGE